MGRIALVVACVLGVVACSTSSPNAPDGADGGTDAAPPVFGDSNPQREAGVGACIPKSCGDQAINCGTAPDGCGGSIFCGACELGKTYGGVARPNTCGDGFCTDKSCSQQSVDCGLVSNGCANVLDGGQRRLECLHPHQRQVPLLGLSTWGIAIS